MSYPMDTVIDGGSRIAVTEAVTAPPLGAVKRAEAAVLYTMFSSVG
jgi:hypothetical protein